MKHNISINAIAPGPTRSAIIPDAMADAVEKVGIEVNDAESIAKAILYSVIAKEVTTIDAYEDDRVGHQSGKPWHGRTIFVFANQYSEVEEPLLETRKQWMGEETEKKLNGA